MVPFSADAESKLTSKKIHKLKIFVLFASFEYNGTFSANRKSGEIQSYYILLNENTNVTFSIKSNGKECKDF